MTPDEPPTTETLLDAFATAGRVLPHAALRHAVDRWAEVGTTLLATLQDVADGADRTDRTNDILFFGIYLMAQLCETRAFHPLCAVAADGERIVELIGDGVTEDLSLILTRTYDDDPAPLRTLIEAADASEYARNAALDSLAWLTATGRIDRRDTARYLRDLFTTLRPQNDCFVWVGWQSAIAHLGLDELVPLVEQAFASGWIDRGVMELDDFQSDLNAARQAAEPTAVFEPNIRDDGRLDDAVRHLSDWDAFRPEDDPMPKQDGYMPIPAAAPQLAVAAPQRPMNAAPLRKPKSAVGRNDPCPCGSGKKFKKCCLGKPQ